MGKISINELNENLQKAISGGALEDDAYSNLSSRADANIQRLQAIAAAAYSVAPVGYCMDKPNK